MSKIERLEKQIMEMKAMKASLMKEKVASPKEYLNSITKYDGYIRDIEIKILKLRNNEKKN